MLRADLRDIADGVLTVTANVSDAYGNAAAQASRGLTVDTGIPTVTIEAISNDNALNAYEARNSLTILGTTSGLNNGQTVTVSVNGQSYTGQSYNSSGVGRWSLSIPSDRVADLVNGRTYSVTANVSDVAGNAATQALRTLLIAKVAPTVTISAIATDDLINAAERGTALVLSGTTTGGNGSQVTVTLNDQSYQAQIQFGGWTVTVPQPHVAALTNGSTYTVAATASDSYGNLPGNATRNLTVAATLPTVAIGPVSGDDAINAAERAASLTLSGTATGADGRTVTVGLNGQSYQATVAGGAWSVVVPQGAVAALAEGTRTVTADVTDMYGSAATTATRSIVVDSTPPTVTIGAIALDDTINAAEYGAAVTVSGTASGADGQAVRVGLNDRSYAASVSAGVWSTTVQAGDVGDLDLGNYTVTADTADRYGNAAQTASRSVLVATTRPVLTIAAITGDDVINAAERGASLTIAGTATGAGGRTVTVALNDRSYTASVSRNTWSVTVPQNQVAALGEGTLAVTASVTDRYGNAALPVSRSVRVDTVAQAPAATLVPGSTAADAVLTGTAEALALLTFRVGGQSVGMTTATAEGAWRYAVPGSVPAGLTTLTVTQTDLAGNVSAASGPVTLPRASTDFAVTDPDFDAAWYLAQNADVAASGMDPLQHYQTYGWHEGRNPNAFFNVTYYLNQNPDVAAAGIDPLRHYHDYGWREGRDPSISFSTGSYLSANPDVAAASMDPLRHLLHYGQAENRMTFLSTPRVTAPQDPLVDATYYYANNPAVAAAGLDPTAHFNSVGWAQRANPDAYFDVNYYLSHNLDVAASGMNPLLHYDTYGWKEGRDPSAAFSTSGYLNRNPDVAAARLDPLMHYLKYGQAEGRAIVPV